MSKTRGTATLNPTHTHDARPQPVIVEAVDGPAKGARRELGSGTMVIGSHRDCDLVIDEPTVSRRHATIELLPGELVVKDLGSRNGTRYLGAKISSASVPVGGSIRVGKTTLRFSLVHTPEVLPEIGELHGMVGQSVAMRRVFALLQKLGPQDTSVLLRGETGAGKGAAARVLHALSARASKPFTVLDCASVHENLMEAAVFGHAKGAFTGADRARAGAIEAADGGTLFLDEIGELPVALQPKLLRVLDTHQFQRVGESSLRRANIRVIAATNRDLSAEVSKGRFRLDLFHRLAVVEVKIPPLRERPDDIPLLARAFARQIAGFDVKLAPATVAAFQCASWPGNVRELRNAVERALTLGHADAQPPSPAKDASFIAARDDAMARFERDYLVALLDRHHGNASAAARTAKLARSHLYVLLKRHGLVGK